MNTFRIPKGYELMGMTTATGKQAWIVLHLRNSETGLDELIRVLAANIPDVQETPYEGV